MFEYSDEYELGIMPMKKGDIIEVDSIEELIDIDNSYKGVFNNEVNI